MIPTDQRAKMDEDCDKFVEIMKSSISLVCRSAINSKNVVKVEGLLGVTLDDQQILLVNVNELFALTPAGSERKPKKTKGAVGGKSSPSRKPQPRRSKKYQTSDAESAGEQEEHEEVKEEDGGGEETADWTMDQDGMDTTVDTSRTHILLTEEEYSQFTHIDSPVKSQPSTSQGPIPLPTDVKGQTLEPGMQIVIKDELKEEAVEEEEMEEEGMESLDYLDAVEVGEDELQWATRVPAFKKTKLNTSEMREDYEYQCATCSNKYPTKESLRYHQKNICSTTDSPIFPCNLCKRYFKNRKAYMSHNLRYHSQDEDLLKCHMCRHQFKCKINLKFHYVNDHGIEGSACGLCEYQGPDVDSLMDHLIATHVPVVGIRCNYCLSYFQDNPELRRHIEEKHNDANAACEMCNKQFTSLRNLRVHMRNCHDQDVTFSFPCKVCNAFFKSKRTLVSHQKSAHRKRPPVITCSKCNKKFKTKVGYKQHMQLHEGDFRFQCHICSEKFAFKSCLDGHVNRHMGVKPYVCSVCGASFYYKLSLSAHEKRQHELSSLPCSACDKVFTSRIALKSHQTRVHNKLCFFCPVCNAAFKGDDEVRDHMIEAHQGTVEAEQVEDSIIFICPICEVEFKNEEDVKEHVMMMHPGEDYNEIHDVVEAEVMETTAEAVAEVYVEGATQVSPEEAIEISPEEVTDMSPAVVTEISPDVVTEISPDVVTKISPDVVTEISPEGITEISPEGNYVILQPQ